MNLKITMLPMLFSMQYIEQQLMSSKMLHMAYYGYGAHSRCQELLVTSTPFRHPNGAWRLRIAFIREISTVEFYSNC